MKKIKILAIEKEAVEKYVNNLKIFFEEYAFIDGISLKEQKITEKVDADIIVVSNPAIFNYVMDLIPNNSQVVYIDIAFYSRDIKQLRSIPEGTKVLLVDYKEYMAISLAALMNEYGINHIYFVPFAADMNLKNVIDFDIAITPGLFEYVPEHIKEVIDIGYRKIDISTITTIASNLQINNFKLNKKMIKYSEELCDKSKAITGILRNLNEDQIHIDAILESIDDGIIITDKDNNILHCSKHICNLSKSNNFDIPCLSEKMHPICLELIKMDEVENHFIKSNNGQVDIVITKKKLNVHDETDNSIIIIKDAEKIQSIEIGIRKSLASKGYLAKYTFKDMIYQSSTMNKIVARAKKIASIDATTLIYGDTGTGKELMAHALHSNSKRSNNPFLAINCAAISENLLESELFGYEEGSFTGAKKGGKKGLFELAHNGTLFLDEISTISQQLQVKLLRVLQEREIIKTGGVNIIPINVRIIVATNENLEELIDNGTFRKDLYYRINNFTINLPPLKDRREDIPLIIKSIMDYYKSSKKIDAELMDFLVNYKWPGNVRELRNCIEYLIFMGDKILTKNDLPPTINTSDNSNNTIGISSPESNDLGELFNDEKEIAKKILEVCSYRSIGRRGLQTLLTECGYNISEYKIRKILNYLKDKNIIYFGKGRSGINLVQEDNHF
nr:sigma 54-interacting transcriptional regulator [Sedimentibacter sp.]